MAKSLHDKFPEYKRIKFKQFKVQVEECFNKILEALQSESQEPKKEPPKEPKKDPPAKEPAKTGIFTACDFRNFWKHYFFSAMDISVCNQMLHTF